MHQYKYSSSKRITRHEADFSGDGYNTWTKEGIAEGLKTIEAIKNYLNEEVTVKKGE